MQNELYQCCRPTSYMPQCDCTECLHQYMRELSRCGCYECAYRRRKAEDRIRYTQYRTHFEATQAQQLRSAVFMAEWPAVTKKLTIGEGDMNIVQKVRNIKLSAGDKLLRKHGVVDAEGVITETGQDLIWDKLLAQYKEELVTDLKAVDAAEKGKK